MPVATGEIRIMGVTVCLPLFGNPGHELEEGTSVKGQHLRNLAAELQDRLQKAGDTLDKLASAGPRRGTQRSGKWADSPLSDRAEVRLNIWQTRCGRV